MSETYEDAVVDRVLAQLVSRDELIRDGAGRSLMLGDGSLAPDGDGYVVTYYAARGCVPQRVRLTRDEVASRLPRALEVLDSQFPAVPRVLGPRALLEAGDPVAVGEGAGLVVIAGARQDGQWSGRDLHRRVDGVGWCPVGIYRAADLGRVGGFTTSLPANAIAVHPAGRLIALGTGSYDGGYRFVGELLIHDLDSGRTTSVLRHTRTVSDVRWHDAWSLEIVVAPTSEDEVEDWDDLRYQSVTLRHPDWRTVQSRSLALPVAAGPEVPAPQVARAPADLVAGLAAQHHIVLPAHSSVWALEVSVSGMLVAGRDGGVEGWRPEEPRGPVWRHDVPGRGVQVLATTTGTVLVNSWHPRPDRAPAAVDRHTTTLVEIDPASGDVLDVADTGRPLLLVKRADGAVLLRDVRHDRTVAGPAVVRGAGGEERGSVALSPYDLFNHYFDVRGADDFLVLVGDDAEPWRDKWVAAVVQGPTGWTVRRLFPLAWQQGAEHIGGPGVFVRDDLGEGLVHGGTVFQDPHLPKDTSYVVRRDLSGRVLWLHVLDSQVTGIDVVDDRVVAVSVAGELVVVDAASGRRDGRRSHVLVGHQPVGALSLARAGAGRWWVGTFDGRIVELTVR